MKENAGIRAWHDAVHKHAIELVKGAVGGASAASTTGATARCRGRERPCADGQAGEIRWVSYPAAPARPDEEPSASARPGGSVQGAQDGRR